MSYDEYRDTEKITYESIIGHMMEAYAQGAVKATIYTGNRLAFNSITKWAKGWIRKAGKDGIWKNSKGKNRK